MRVRVLYFSTLRASLGAPAEEALELPPGATLGDALALLARARPALEEFRASMMLTLNREWATPEAPLADGDEVGLMPPVSGG